MLRGRFSTIWIQIKMGPWNASKTHTKNNFIYRSFENIKRTINPFFLKYCSCAQRSGKGVRFVNRRAGQLCFGLLDIISQTQVSGTLIPQDASPSSAKHISVFMYLKKNLTFVVRNNHAATPVKSFTWSGRRPKTIKKCPSWPTERESWRQSLVGSEVKTALYYQQLQRNSSKIVTVITLKANSPKQRCPALLLRYNRSFGAAVGDGKLL